MAKIVKPPQVVEEPMEVVVVDEPKVEPLKPEQPEKADSSSSSGSEGSTAYVPLPQPRTAAKLPPVTKQSIALSQPKISAVPNTPREPVSTKPITRSAPPQGDIDNKPSDFAERVQPVKTPASRQTTANSSTQNNQPATSNVSTGVAQSGNQQVAANSTTGTGSSSGVVGSGSSLGTGTGIGTGMGIGNGTGTGTGNGTGTGTEPRNGNRVAKEPTSPNTYRQRTEPRDNNRDNSPTRNRSGKVNCIENCPDYSRRALQQGIEGKTGFVVDTDDKGNVISARLTSSSGNAQLDEDAIRKIKKTRFSSKLRGRAVNLNFEIEGSDRSRRNREQRRTQEVARRNAEEAPRQRRRLATSSVASSEPVLRVRRRRLETSSQGSSQPVRVRRQQVETASNSAPTARRRRRIEAPSLPSSQAAPRRRRLDAPSVGNSESAPAPRARRRQAAPVAPAATQN